MSYRAKSASLVLFDKPQPSPFGSLAARILAKGQSLRLEVTDHWGRTHVWITDRLRGTTWRLLENQQYSTESAGSCDDLPAQVAATLAHGLATSGIDSVTISAPVAKTWQNHPARQTEWIFRVRLFGLPRPVWVQADVYFSVPEHEFFGQRVAELYCGRRPAEADWTEALLTWSSLPEAAARRLAQVIGLPVALDMRSDLGMGKATLVLEAFDVSAAKLDPALFELPDGYRPVSP